MNRLNKIDGASCRSVQYRIVEWRDDRDQFICFICAVMMNGKVVGDYFECRTHEQKEAWLRLVSGGYQVAS